MSDKIGSAVPHVGANESGDNAHALIVKCRDRAIIIRCVIALAPT